MSEAISISLAVVAAFALIVGSFRVSTWLADRKGRRTRYRRSSGAPGIVAGESYGKGGLDGGDAVDGGGSD